MYLKTQKANKQKTHNDFRCDNLGGIYISITIQHALAWLCVALCFSWGVLHQQTVFWHSWGPAGIVKISNFLYYCPFVYTFS